MNFKKTVFSCKRNGLTIRGIEYRPQGENLPIAILSHGFMANKCMCKNYAKVFASLGYVSYIFDFCGGCLWIGKSDGKTQDMSVLTEVEDLKAVIDYASGLPYANANEIVLAGCSQGGFVSAIVASQLVDKVKKLILFYPAFCIPDDARSGKMMFAKFNPQNPPATFYCGPMKLGKRYVTDIIKINPFEVIKQYENDILIIHGDNDKIVDISYAKQALKTYQQRQTKAISRLEIINGGKHTFNKKHDKIAISRLQEFIKRQ